MPEVKSSSDGRLLVRLFAEFWVIVLGVLVALAVDAALEARAERVLEYRRLTRDFLPFEVRRRLNARSIEAFDPTLVNDVRRQLRGNGAVLAETEDMIVDWTQLTLWWEQQRSAAIRLLQLLEARS